MNCKKFATRALSVLLSIVMLIGIVPFSVSADTPDPVIYEGSTLLRPDNRGYMASLVAATEDAPKHYHVIGTNANTGRFALTNLTGGNAINVDPTDTPVIKLYYRTNVVDGDSLAVPSNVGLLDTGGAEMITATKMIDYYDAVNSEPATEVGEWGYAIYDISTSTCTKVSEFYFLPYLKNDTNNYIDVAYIGFFPSVNDAVAARPEFIPEPDPVIYTGDTLIKPDNRGYFAPLVNATETAPKHYHVTGKDANTGRFALTNLTGGNSINFDPTDTPVIKLYYRTNLVDGDAIVPPASIGVLHTGGDFSVSATKMAECYDATNSSPATKVGEWGYAIYDISSTGCTKVSEFYFTKYLKDSVDNYIDIAYVGFFPSVSSALEAESGLVKVTFYEEDKTTEISSYQKWGNATVDYPETDPVKDGFLFQGWKDVATDELVADGTAITKDTELYAYFLDPAKLPKIYTGDDLVDSYNAYGADYPSIVAATDTTPSHYRLPGGNGATSNKMTMRWTNETAKGFADYRYFPTKHPYVKIYYRTNIMDGENLLVPKFEHTGSGWNPDASPVAALDSSDPATVAGEWGYAIYKFENAKYSDTVYCRDISLYRTLKTLPSTDYVDVAYIGFFATEDEAIAAEADFAKVTFYEEDGTTVYLSKMVWIGGGAVLEYPETAPEKDGHVFISWVDENDKIVRNGSTLTEDLKLYPRFMDENAIVLKGADLPDGGILGLYGMGTTPTAASGAEPTRYVYDAGKLAYIYIDALDISNSMIMKIYYRTNIEIGGELYKPDPAEIAFMNNGMINIKGPALIDEATAYATEAGEWGYFTYDLSDYSDFYPADEQVVKDNFDNLYYVVFDLRQISGGSMEIGYVGFFANVNDAKNSTFESEEIKVEFLAEDGSVFYTYNAWETGALVEMPEEDPVSADRELVFKGWFTEEGGEGEQITSKTIVENDITAYPFFDVPDDKKNAGTVLNVMLKLIEDKKTGGAGAASSVKPLYLFDGNDLATSSGLNKVEGSLKDGYYRFELKTNLEMKDGTIAQIRFLGDTVTVDEAPIMVVGYRTNYNETEDSTFGGDFCFYNDQMSIGRAWGGGSGTNAAPKKIADEQWQKAIINLEGRIYTGGDGMFSGKTAEERAAIANTAPIAGWNMRFAKIGTTVPKKTYLDIQYIAFFDDYKKASKYVYAPETEEAVEEVVEETTEAAE